MPRPHYTRRVVLPWPGRPLVFVQPDHGWHAIMLATPGEVEATPQCYCSTLDEAVQDAREDAKTYGWRYVGVHDEEHFRQVAALRFNEGGAA